MCQRRGILRQKKKGPVALASPFVTISMFLEELLQTRCRVEGLTLFHSPLSESPHCKMFNSFYMNKIKIKFPGCIWFSQ